MSRPHVVTHTLISVDGRPEGFPPDVERYYELASRIPHEAVLAGSGTMAVAAQAAGVDLTAGDPGPRSREHASDGAPDLPSVREPLPRGHVWLRYDVRSG